MDKMGPQHTVHASCTQSKALLSIIFHQQQVLSQKQFSVKPFW